MIWENAHWWQVRSRKSWSASAALMLGKLVPWQAPTRCMACARADSGRLGSMLRQTLVLKACKHQPAPTFLPFTKPQYDLYRFLWVFPFSLKQIVAIHSDAWTRMRLVWEIVYVHEPRMRLVWEIVYRLWFELNCPNLFCDRWSLHALVSVFCFWLWLWPGKRPNAIPTGCNSKHRSEQTTNRLHELSAIADLARSSLSSSYLAITNRCSSDPWSLI